MELITLPKSHVNNMVEELDATDGFWQDARQVIERFMNGWHAVLVTKPGDSFWMWVRDGWPAEHMSDAESHQLAPFAHRCHEWPFSELENIFG